MVAITKITLHNVCRRDKVVISFTNYS